jgi:carboxypeptidase Taq
MEETIASLKTLLAEVADVERAGAVLSWDQEVHMPPGGGAARAEAMATLGRIAHEMATSDEIGRLLEELGPWAEAQDPEGDDAAIVRVARRDFEKNTKIPSQLVAELSRTCSRANEAWKEALRSSDYESFRPHLEAVLDLVRQKADALGWEECRYDALLDLFEPEMKTAQVARVFRDLKTELVPFVRDVLARGDRVDDAILRLEYDEDRQWAFGEEVVRKLGYDFETGRQDRSTHPFTTSFSPSDVRITTRLDRRQFRTMLFGTIHEAGHAMYEQGLPVELDRTPLCRATSLGIHESQSRLWENQVGRGLPFWRHFFPRLQEVFPENLGGVSLEEFHRAINRAEASPVRVEADEVTYNLHVMLRFEIENEMLEGNVDLKDLPDLWNTKMAESLGIVPENDSLGVLQDIHWSWGMIGYFPTYTLGTLVSAQLWETALEAIPEIPARMEEGDFSPLLEWLRANIHRHGSRYVPAELVKRVTGSDLDAGPFLRYLTTKYGEIYGL